MAGETPELSVVVLSYGNEATLGAALESLRAQPEPLEIVVSHSGAGEPPRDVPCVVSAARRTPGAARNAGIAATSAPHIAFLAADCTALPGWAAGRLRRHRAGARAVASAMAPPDGGAALAAHLLQHSTRMPHVDVPPPLRFGVSYAREVFAEHGEFPADLPGEEDVVFNGRLLAAGVEIEWAPDVMATHAYAESPPALLSDQYRRGRMRYAMRGCRRPRGVLVARALLDGPAGLRRVLLRDSPVSRRSAARASPLVAAGALATAAGIATGRRS